MMPAPMTATVFTCPTLNGPPFPDRSTHRRPPWPRDANIQPSAFSLQRSWRGKKIQCGAGAPVFLPPHSWFQLGPPVLGLRTLWAAPSPFPPHLSFLNPSPPPPPHSPFH